MKYLPLVWAGLWRKPTRTIFTFLSIVVAFVLFGVLQGIDSSIAYLMEKQREDRLLTYVPFGFGTPLPVSYMEQIKTLPGVTLVAAQGGIGGFWQDPKNNVFVAMTDETMMRAYPELEIDKDQLAAWRQSRTAMLVSVPLATRYGWKIGDKIPIQTSNFIQADGSKVWTFDVVGLFADRDNPEREFGIGNYAYFDEGRVTNKGTAQIFVVRIADPRKAGAIGEAIDDMFATSGAPTHTTSERALAQANQNSIVNVGFFIKTIVAAVFFTLLVLTANTMMQSVRERVPELAVLKTLGFTDGGVLKLVLAESAAICAAGAVVGLIVAKFAAPLARDIVGSAATMPLVVFPMGIVAALLVALVSAWVPAWRAKRLVIVDALAGR